MQGPTICLDVDLSLHRSFGPGDGDALETPLPNCASWSHAVYFKFREIVRRQQQFKIIFKVYEKGPQCNGTPAESQDEWISLKKKKMLKGQFVLRILLPTFPVTARPPLLSFYVCPYKSESF